MHDASPDGNKMDGLIFYGHSACFFCWKGGKNKLIFL
jgi:hypothetical protein